MPDVEKADRTKVLTVKLDASKNGDAQEVSAINTLSAAYPIQAIDELKAKHGISQIHIVSDRLYRGPYADSPGHCKRRCDDRRLLRQAARLSSRLV